MKYVLALSLIFLITIVSQAEDKNKQSASKVEPKNKEIDYEGFLKLALESKNMRLQKRLSEKDFLNAMQSNKYILLDCRSEKMFKLRHIKGAINLPFTEFTEKTLTKIIPNKNSKILIYCNNNFLGDPKSMMLKKAISSLNISTQVSLRGYNYHNIYELAPRLDVKKTILPFAGTDVVEISEK